ncbi:MAG: glycosyltransferase involved in cell wall biosynthesis, partial [Cryomorphaceae bacterium]
MSDRESRLKDELKIKSNDVEMLRRQKAQLHSEIRELNSLSEVVLKVIRLTKNIHKSSTWKIGRFGVNLISRLTLRKPKADFMVEIGQIETELLDFAKLGHVEDDQELKHREGESNIASASVKRRYRKFDTKLESKIKLGLNDYVSSNPDIRSVTVSIVMPTHNRAHTLARAIDSVVAQEHKSWELIVVDDGSTDNTDEVLEIYSNERRIKFHKIRKSGVGSARNVALENATGDIISFLDSDNEWYPDYLTLTVASLKKNDACIAYSGLELTTGEEIVGYRGDKFDYAACLVGNYVDLNCFSHRREVFSANRFDIGLKRYNDWDYILHVTKGQHVSYIPFVGVKYFINASEDQISLKEPFVYRKLVSAIHSSRSELDTEARPSVMQVLEDLSLSFGFRVATKDSLSPSYDFRAAQGLRQALERRGHSVHIYYSEERVLENQHDIVLSIRGSDYHPPIKGMLNVVWSIGDPASTGLDELDEFDMIFVASRSFQKMLQLDLGRSVYYLPNATDRSQFFYSCSSEPGIASEFVYIGDAGDEESQSVKHAQYAQLPLSVYGNGWVDIIPAESHKGSWLRQEDERPLYANSLGVLLEQSKEHNDYGYVDGMVFDGLASGASVLTEFSYELDSLLSNTVAMYSDSATFTQAVEMSRSIASNPEVQTEISSLMLNVHSYDNRARTFSESINSFIANRPIDQQCNQQLSVFSQAVNSMLSGKESLAERLFNKR